jgi:hypothetical protein
MEIGDYEVLPVVEEVPAIAAFTRRTRSGTRGTG